MTNTERFTALAKIGHESAQCAFGDDMPPAHVVWSFLLSNSGDGLIEDCALALYMQDSAPETMPDAFRVAYDAIDASYTLNFEVCDPANTRQLTTADYTVAMGVVKSLTYGHVPFAVCFDGDHMDVTMRIKVQSHNWGNAYSWLSDEGYQVVEY